MNADPAISRAVGFGIDIGGSGIKGAPVDLASGTFARDRVRIPTPSKSSPQNIIEIVLELVETFGWNGPFGCAVPGIVHRGVVRSAANIDDSWIGFDLASALRERTGHEVTVLNDADAAGLGEARFGAARDENGLVVLTTLGTGIGSAVVHNGVLLPNTEFGHLYLSDGTEAEHHAAAAVREDLELTWEDWADRLQAFYEHLEFVLSPDLFVVGGGISKKADRFLPQLRLRTPIVPAALRNDAGVIGAAVLAAEHRP